MEDLRKTYRVAVIIGLAMMASLLVYTIIVGVFEQAAIPPPEGGAASGSQLEIVKFIMLGASIIVFFLIRPVNARMLAAGEARGAHPPAALRSSAAASSPLQRLTIAAIVTYALCEAPAVFGLVLFFIGRSSADFYLFLIISLFCFASHFPRYSQWEEWYRQQGGGGRRN